MGLGIPPGVCRLTGYFAALLGRQLGRPCLAALLPTQSAEGDGMGVFTLTRLLVLDLTRGNIHDELGPDVGITWSLGLA